MHTKEQGFAHDNVTRNPQKKSCNEKQEGIHEDARVSHCESIRLLRHAPTTWVNGAFQRRGDTLSGIRALCLCLFTSHHRYRQAGDCPTLIDLRPLHGAHTHGTEFRSTNTFIPATSSRLSFSRFCISARAIESETVRPRGGPTFFTTAYWVGNSAILPYPAADEASDRTEHEASEAENPLKCVGLPAHSFTGT